MKIRKHIYKSSLFFKKRSKVYILKNTSLFMGWFTKKEKEQKNESKISNSNLNFEVPKLPELPKSDIKDIKNSLDNRHPIHPMKRPPEQIKRDPNNPRSIESQEFSKIEKPSIHNPTNPFQGIEPPKITREKDPIFVKLDKFKEASANFEKIKDKVQDIEEMLQEIKEIKEKENQELSEWEQELHIIKQRIESIDNSIFKKVGE